MSAPPTRRRIVVIGIALVAGTVLHGIALRQPTGTEFTVATLLMAVPWLLATVLCAPVPVLPRRPTRDLPVAATVGAVALVITLLAGLVAARIPPLRGPVEQLLSHADAALATVLAVTILNGVAEELFFRGALYDSLPRRHAVTLSTLLYAATTAAAGIVLLTVAAVFLGLLTALLRRHTGGVLAPVVTHLIWSVGMLLLLPGTLSTGG